MTASKPRVLVLRQDYLSSSLLKAPGLSILVAFLEDTRTNYPRLGAGQLFAADHLLASEIQPVTATCDTGARGLTRTARVESGVAEVVQARVIGPKCQPGLSACQVGRLGTSDPDPKPRLPSSLELPYRASPGGRASCGRSVMGEPLVNGC